MQSPESREGNGGEHDVESQSKRPKANFVRKSSFQWAKRFASPRGARSPGRSPRISPRRAREARRGSSGEVSECSGTLPSCSNSRIIIAVAVAEARSALDTENQEPAVWLPIPIEAALENTGDWLDERVLRTLLKLCDELVRTRMLADPDPHCLFTYEQHTPTACFLGAFVMTCLTCLSLLMGWGQNFQLGAGALSFFVLGIIFFYCCVHHRDYLIGEDPTPICRDFAAEWSAKFKLPLTFHKRWGGPSYFELRRSGATPRAKTVEGDEESDGWEDVKSPTARRV